MSTELAYKSIEELGQAYREGSLSPVEVTDALLQRAEQADGQLNAYRELCPDRARASAFAAEAELRAGVDRGPLHGVPYVAKDLYDVAGMATTGGARLLEGAVAQQDCAVIERLSNAGMVLLGKTNTVQFAYGGAGINHDHGTPHNPWSDTPHLPGGSSSGTGVAVAAGFAPMGLGSDTGGSVRIPASLNGVTGLKTTVGRISRDGVFPLSWTLDTVGPLARSVMDCALSYQAMNGPDRRDESTLGHAAHNALEQIDGGVRHLRLGVAEGLLFEDIDPEVEGLVRATLPVFQELGAKVASFDLPEARQALQINPAGLITAAEAYTLNKSLVDGHFDELDPIAAHRVIKGAEVPAEHYLRALRERATVCVSVHERLRDIDALLCPTVMIPPRTVAESDASIDSYSQINLQCLRNTMIGNFLNFCALSVPCGFTDAGLPVGLMIYSKAFDEAKCLRIGHAFQQATDWHQARPELSWL